MGLYFVCNFVGAFRTVGELVSQTKFGGNVNNVRHRVCMCHLDQLRVRWRCFSLAEIVLRHSMTFLISIFGYCYLSLSVDPCLALLEIDPIKKT